MSGSESSPGATRAGVDESAAANATVRRASVIAGVGLLLIAVLAAFGNFLVVEKLVTRGDAGQTARGITASEGMFRLGIASLFSAAVLDVVVAWALFTVFEPVSRGLSLLSAWFRVVYAGVFVVAASQLVGVLHRLNNAASLGAFGTDQLHAQALLGITAFDHIWNAGLVLFGVHLLLLGYLTYRSTYAPTFLGALLVLSGLGYLIDSVGAVISAGYSAEIARVTFVGEVVLIFWLLVVGRRVVVSDEPVAPAP